MQTTSPPLGLLHRSKASRLCIRETGMKIVFNGGLNTPIPSSVLCNFLHWTYGELVEHTVCATLRRWVLFWNGVLALLSRSQRALSCLPRQLTIPVLLSWPNRSYPWDCQACCSLPGGSPDLCSSLRSSRVCYSFPKGGQLHLVISFLEEKEKKNSYPTRTMGVPMVPSSEVSPSLPWPWRPSQLVLPRPKRLSSLFISPLTSVSGPLTPPCSPLQPQSNQRCWQCWS